LHPIWKIFRFFLESLPIATVTGNTRFTAVASRKKIICVAFQKTDSEGTVTFQTIFPACYSGRWPHIHFEMYSSLAEATTADNKVHTSQLALPQDVCDTVYTAADGYSESVNNLSQLTLETDNVLCRLIRVNYL
jgi:protocatechuate 3,4-dioxygenase beta subunit